MHSASRRHFALVAGMVVALLIVGSPVAGATGLAGTKHDFSRTNPANPFKDARNACEPCHRYLKTPLPTRIGGIEVRLRGTAVCLSCHVDTAQHPVDVPLPEGPKFRTPAELPQLVFYGQERLMGCTTCHDTHNGKGFPCFLRMVGEDDALCRTCHNF